MASIPSTIRRARVAAAIPFVATFVWLGLARAASADDVFQDTVKPFIKSHCAACHNDKQAEAELNLTRYLSAEMAADDFRQWEHVLTFVAREEMPPADANSMPTAEARQAFLKNVRAMLDAEGRKLAGDPGPVLPRRLSNAEYDHTIRDLTGVDIRPTRSFPVDPAAGEGFDNTGEALAMSPSLFAKLYAAAQFVSEHALLTTTGVEFAPYPVVTFADRTKYYEQAILQFYERHKIDYAKYLTACWEYQRRPASRQAIGIADWARERGLSAKYLGSLHAALTSDAPEFAQDKYCIAWLRWRWRELPTVADDVNTTANKPANGPENKNANNTVNADSSPPTREVREAIERLARDIQSLSRELCPRETPAIVSNAGNGPIQHLDRRRRTAAERATFEPKSAPLARRLHVDFHKDPNAKPPSSTDPLDPAEATEALAPDDPALAEITRSGAAFCRLFPNRFFFVDDTRGLSAGFHLIEGFFRDDQPLCQSVLDDDENRELDRLWTELEFVADVTEKMLRGFVFFERSERNFLKHADFDSFKEEDPKLVERETLERFEQVYLARSNVKGTPGELAKHPIHVFFEQIRAGLERRRQLLRVAEPAYLKNIETFARAAYRRPLTDAETEGLRKFFHQVAEDPEQGYEPAVRASLVRILVSPYFGCHIRIAPEGETLRPLADHALASRLSYFLWSSMPDAELLQLAEAGRLNDDQVLREQTRRMLRDPRVRDFVRECFGQWLGYRDFPQQESVDRMAFRDFDDALKQAMFEEPTRFIADLIARDRPVTELLNADHTFVDARLAKHYGLVVGKDPSLAAGDWTKVDGLHGLGRGGVLGMAVFLTKNSQPQRTSPVKRGFWVIHKILGEHIPAPPADVVALPAKETDTNGKTIRQLLALHVEDVKCARCHQRFDAVGLAMEGFDPIGRRRSKDLAGRPVDDVVRLADGADAHGVPEFAQHLVRNRRDEYVDTLCRKLLGFALGRSLQLSDQALLEEMRVALDSHGDRFVPLLETIVRSPQFRTQRCRDFSTASFRAERGKSAVKPSN